MLEGSVCECDLVLCVQGVYGAIFIKLNLLWVKFKRKKCVRFPIPLLEVCRTTDTTHTHTHTHTHTDRHRMPTPSLLSTSFPLSLLL